MACFLTGNHRVFLCNPIIVGLKNSKTNVLSVYKSTGTFAKRCPKGYTSVTVGGTPTDAKAREKSPEVVILFTKRHSFRKHVLK
jgi:hypothetical protein